MSSGPDDTKHQILLKLLMDESAQYENSTMIFNFVKKVRFSLRVFSILSYGLSNPGRAPLSVQELKIISILDLNSSLFVSDF